MINKEGQVVIGRRALLLGSLAGGAAVLAGVGILSSRENSASSVKDVDQDSALKKEPQKEPNSDPETAGRLFAQAALERNFDAMLNQMAPDTRRVYSSMFTSRQAMEIFLGTYNCPSGKLSKNLAVVRHDQYNVENVWNATYQIDGQCIRKSNPGLLDVSVREITVILEKVIQGGKEKYYPKRTG